MRAHYSREHHTRELPDSASLLRQYKRWEAGEVEPDRGRAEPLYKPIIAATFGTVTHAMFPVAPKRDADADVLAVTGMDTLELVSRLQRSDLDQATIDALRIMADRLCSEYPFMPGDQLVAEGITMASSARCVRASRLLRITAWPSSSRRKKRKHGRASGTAGTPKSRSTKGAGFWKPCPTPITWTTISSSTRPSSTSTRWTATGISPRTA